MKQEELEQLEALLVKFGVVVLNRPYSSKGEERKNEALFQRVTNLRGHVAVETERVKHACRKCHGLGFDCLSQPCTACGGRGNTRLSTQQPKEPAE